MDADARNRLLQLLRDDPVAEVRREAARALGVAVDGGDEVVGPLVEALDDENDGVRRAATLALGRIGDERAGAALLDALEHRPELWQETSAALATSGREGLIERLLPLLDSESSQVRRGALRAVAGLTKRRHHEPDEPLFVYTDDEGHQHPLF